MALIVYSWIALRSTEECDGRHMDSHSVRIMAGSEG